MYWNNGKTAKEDKVLTEILYECSDNSQQTEGTT